MRQDVEEYIKSCLICQQDKPNSKMIGGLLQSMCIPQRPWESISIDFFTQLPILQGYNGILVMVDRVSKYATFVPTKMPC